MDDVVLDVVRYLRQLGDVKDLIMLRSGRRNVLIVLLLHQEILLDLLPSFEHDHGRVRITLGNSYGVSGVVGLTLELGLLVARLLLLQSRHFLSAGALIATLVLLKVRHLLLLVPFQLLKLLYLLHESVRVLDGLLRVEHLLKRVASHQVRGSLLVLQLLTNVVGDVLNQRIDLFQLLVGDVDRLHALPVPLSNLLFPWEQLVESLDHRHFRVEQLGDFLLHNCQ